MYKNAKTCEWSLAWMPDHLRAKGIEPNGEENYPLVLFVEKREDAIDAMGIDVETFYTILKEINNAIIKTVYNMFEELNKKEQ